MAAHNAFGSRAEDRAAAFLAAAGWAILHRNWRFGHKEIDIIARRGGLVAFVEVKARRSTLRGHPLECIGRRKRRDLETAARAWITQHARPTDSFRFDAIAVLADGELLHVEAAW